uniref:Uncharacterized protein n=1 Tax=viral metagenome TaxID=1070528 RepID=A0A6M3MBR9_9ZZZZ
MSTDEELMCEICGRFFSDITWFRESFNTYKCPVCGTKYLLKLEIQSSASSPQSTPRPQSAPKVKECQK